MNQNRTPIEIGRDIEAATALRAGLWHELSNGHDPTKTAEVARLNGRIEELWSEYRAARNRDRFGTKERIVARARAEERLERDLARVAA
jgi:hypothetical protein